MENLADVILVPSRLAGKVESIDCHTYASTTYILLHILIKNLIINSKYATTLFNLF